MNDFRMVLLAATVILTGCNTSDALIPREDIGSTSHTSPVTQEETRQLARSATPETGTTAYQPIRQPQNTLEAQARALEGGAMRSPAASAPMDEAQQDDLTSPSPTGNQVAALPAASSSGGNTIRFLPIIGAPVQAVTPLSRQLGTEARAGGLTIKSTSDTGAEHVLKGYLSAYADAGKINVIYVWDVLDSSGARLHRIQGEESAPGSGSDPWAAVPAETMQAIGVKTITRYREWLASQRS